MKAKTKLSRKDFLKKSALGIIGTAAATGAGKTNVLATIFPASVLGANDRINMGFIGIGNRGTLLLNLFMKEKNCKVAALSDVYQPYLDRNRNAVDPRILSFCKQVPKMEERFDSAPQKYPDYRHLLDNKDIDAVCIATPDHWHALQTIDAMSAGKDVYVEKPLTATLVEGRKMVEAQKHYDRIAAVGLNRRGCAVYQKLAAELPGGKIGKISVASAARINNMFPDGIGNFQPERIPDGFNWDLWLGPRASRGWQRNIAPYYFRWWHEYSSQMGNWGVHYLDVIRWMLAEQAPVAVYATGGKYVLTDDRTIPDTMQVVFEFASGAIANFSIYEATSSGLFSYGEVELRGTKGILNADESGYTVRPATAGQNQVWDSKHLLEKEEVALTAIQDLGDGSNSNSTQVLVRNFLECVVSRRDPLCTLEEGHRSTSFAHLANIALATKTRLEWNPAREVFKNSKEANQLLHYEYRAPWKLKV